MNLPPPDDAHRRHTWIFAWLALTLTCSLMHYFVWNPPLRSGASIAFPGEAIIKPINNALQCAILPAWVLVWKILGRYQDLPTTLLANALGWLAWILAAYGILRLRARITRTDSRGTAPPRVPTGAALPPVHHERRRFLMDAGLLAGGSAAAIGGGVATLISPWQIQVTRYSVPIAGLPRSLDGLRIVQISDTHLGPRIPRAHVRTAIDMAAALKPDLIALTGDYIHMGTWYIAPAIDLFAELVTARAARLGVVAVLGNHDYYGDPGLTRSELTRIGVRMLENDRVFIDHRPALHDDPPAAGEGLCIAGTGDLLEGVVDLGAALRGVPAEMPRLLLTHHPDTVERLAGREDGGDPAPRIDLQLSGHTHGGQISIPGYGPPIVPSMYGRRFAYGLVTTTAGRMIVTSGVGMSIMPVRVNMPPEIVEITLRSQERV